MKLFTLFCAGLLAISSLALHAQGEPFSACATPAIDIDGMSYLPASLSSHRSEVFTENRGQWGSEARFQMKLNGMNVWITDSGAVYDFFWVDDRERSLPYSLISSHADDATGSTLASERTVRGHVVRLDFLHSSPTSQAVGVDDIGRRSNYFIGNDRSNWGADCRSYRSVRLRGLYRGIDAVITQEGGLPRFDLIVAPGSNPSAIRFRLDGADSLCVGSDGDLTFTTSLGRSRMGRLYAYQRRSDNAITPVPCSFRVDSEGKIGFSLGQYDGSRELIIDPLIYSSFLGGDMIDDAHAVSVEESGEVWIVGETMAGYFQLFPTTPGAYAEFRGRGWNDLFISRLNPALSGADQLTYSTILAGSLGENANALALDGQGGLWVAGESFSRSFPMTSNAVDTVFEGNDHEAILLHLDPSRDGADQLTYSSYFGGTEYETAYDISLDDRGIVWIAGITSSENMATTVNAFNNTLDSTDGFVLGVDPTQKGKEGLYYSTYIGADGIDYVLSIEVDAEEKIWIGGIVSDSPVPYVTTDDAFATSFTGGTTDAFVTRFDPEAPTATQVLYSTFIGGDSSDRVVSLALDSNGSVWAVGNTIKKTIDIATTDGTPDDRDRRGRTDVFTMRFDILQSSVDVGYSALIGGSEHDLAASVAVGHEGEVWILGSTEEGAHDFPTTTGAFDEEHNALLAERYSRENTDVFLAKLDVGGSSGGLAYSTFLGGAHRDIGNDLAIDRNGYLWMVGHAEYERSMPFPVTGNAYDGLHSMEVPPQIKENDSDAFLTCLDPRVASDISIPRPIPLRLELTLLPSSQLFSPPTPLPWPYNELTP